MRWKCEPKCCGPGAPRLVQQCEIEPVVSDQGSPALHCGEELRVVCRGGQPKLPRTGDIMAGLPKHRDQAERHIVVEVEVSHLGAIQQQASLDALLVPTVVSQRCFHCLPRQVVISGQLVGVAVQSSQLSDEGPDRDAIGPQASIRIVVQAC